jgi:hypothetical protein
MADIFPTGTVEFWVAVRSAEIRYYYLGTAIGWPVIEERKLHRDLRCDRSGDGPWQKVSTSEQHLLTVTLNRIEYSTLNRLNTGTPSPTTFSVSPGKLIFNAKDVRLFFRYAIPNALAADGQPLVPGTSTGRLYYSASLEVCREAQPKRVQEVGLIFECNQLWDNNNRKWKFYTEDGTSADWPTDLTRG